MTKKELYTKMLIMENEYCDESIVIDHFKDLCKENRDDINLFYDINELFEERGYAVRFLSPSVRHKKKFDLKEYKSLTSKVTLSKDKTFKLIKYLKEVNDRRLTLASLYLIKLKWLVSENILDSNNKYIKKCLSKDYNLQETLFKNYNSNDKDVKQIIFDIKHTVFKLLSDGELGEYDVYFDVNEFVLDSEYLMYSINNYKLTNSIKVVLKITESEFFDIYSTKQYNTQFDNVNKFLNLINKDLVKQYLVKYKDMIDVIINDGYVLLYRTLELNNK